jgi:hypothetical protein
MSAGAAVNGGSEQNSFEVLRMSYYTRVVSKVTRSVSEGGKRLASQ